MMILVTGASGFVGYAVATLLTQRGHDVLGLTRSATSRLPGHVRRVHGDLHPETLLAALDNVDGVCHLAARTRVRESCTDPLGYWQTNVGGTLALLHAMSATGTQGLVLASTCGVYGDQASRPIKESAPTAPTSPYRTSKLAADNAAMDLASTGAIGVTNLRAFNIADALPGHPDSDETRLIPRMIAVQRGTAPELVVDGDGDAIRDFVHVADMAEAFALALDASEPGAAPVYNIGSGRPTPVRDVIDMVNRSPVGPSPDDTCHPRPNRKSYSPTARQFRPISAGTRADLTCARSSRTPGPRRPANRRRPAASRGSRSRRASRSSTS